MSCDLKKDVVRQLRNINKFLVENNIILAYQEPKITSNTIELSSDVSFVLNNENYESIYNECIKNKAFNFLLLDTAIIQLMYEFDNRGKKLKKHRLAYFPNPNVEQFVENLEYENIYFNSKNISVEYIEKNSVVFPIRFDFDIDNRKYKEIDHPKSHLTLGNYKNCRIPVSSWLTPKLFVEFILRNFYYKKFKKIESNWKFKIKEIKNSFLNTNFLSNNEKKIIHLNYE